MFQKYTFTNKISYLKTNINAQYNQDKNNKCDRGGIMINIITLSY